MSYTGVAMEQGERIIKLEAEAIVLRAHIAELEAKIESLEDEAIEVAITHDMEMDR